MTLATAKNPDGFFSWLIPAGFANPKNRIYLSSYYHSKLGSFDPHHSEES